MSVGSYEVMEEALRERLSDRAFDHSVEVAEMARLIATVYSVDADDARLAGLLHDWDREIPAESLVDVAQELGIEVSGVDREVPYLLHARTAVVHLRQAFPELGDEILQAIGRHTVGQLEMTDLDKVVYVADMLAPGRRYEGVDELRAQVGTVSLNDLFGQCYQQSVAHLVRERRHLHPDTVAVWNRLVARDR